MRTRGMRTMKENETEDVPGGERTQGDARASERTERWIDGQTVPPPRCSRASQRRAEVLRTSWSPQMRTEWYLEVFAVSGSMDGWGGEVRTRGGEEGMRDET